MLLPVHNHRTVLLIEDDEDDCYLFRRALFDLDPHIDIKSTYSADHLVNILERTQPALIFIDLHLPKQNGLECIKIIRSLAAFENVPVVFWSGSCDMNNVMSAYKAGAQYYFEKPNCISDLIAELKKIFFNQDRVVDSTNMEHSSIFYNECQACF